MPFMSGLSAAKTQPFPGICAERKFEMIRYDLPGHCVMADAGEWVIVEGRIVAAKAFQNPGCHARLIYYDRFCKRGRPVVCSKNLTAYEY